MRRIKNILLASRVKQDVADRRGKLYRIAYSWCHNASQADDLAQETMIKALKKCDSLKDYVTLDAWLYRILFNNWQDYLRVQGRSVEYTETRDESRPEQIEDYQEGQIVYRVRMAISSLPGQLREVVTLADFAGFSYVEIAEIIDIPVGTVMSRLYRARQALKEKLLDLAGDSTVPVKLMRVK